MGLDMYLFKSKNGKDIISYWRKENAIHRWFVENVQNGKDDCGMYEVCKEDIIKLRDVCKKVLDSIDLVHGKVVDSYFLDEDSKMVPKYKDGLVVKDASVCKEFLPTCSGFFFGDTDYNEWYKDGVQYTFNLCTNLLSNFDFDEEKLYYHSSW